MHILFMLFFLAVWLLILWIGATALEATGVERSRARFHALSALSGTGFTTSHAEAIVEHPVRRRIAATLIFIGNAGVLSFIIALLVFVRDGITMPELYLLVIAIVVLLLMVLALWLGLVDKITDGILKMTGSGKKKVLYESGGSVLAMLAIGDKAAQQTMTLQDINVQRYNIDIITFEHNGTINRSPGQEQKLDAGDVLLCYGKLDDISNLTKLVF